MQGKALEQGRRWTSLCKVPVQSRLVCQVQWRISKTASYLDARYFKMPYQQPPLCGAEVT